MVTPQRAAEIFAERLATQTDVADVHTALAGLTEAAAGESGSTEAAAGGPGFVLVDTRSAAGWAQGHIPGALHLPTAAIDTRAAELLDPAVPVVTYCWGPGCNGATKAALALSRRGYAVREMIGGVEYWIREGFPLRTPDGDVERPADPLVIACGC